MARDRINRTLTLRTAINNTDFGKGSGGPGTLEKLIRRLHQDRTTVAQRRARFQDFVVECRHAEETAKGVFLHLAAYVPNDLIAVVPNADRSREADLRLLKPPANTEFHDGDVMAFVKGDDIALCRSGLPEGALTSYVMDLSNECGIDSRTSTFSMFKRPDVDKLALIRKDGIKSVSLNSIAHAASVSRVERESIKHTIIGNALEELKTLAGITEDIPEDAENLKVEVMFSFDKRNGTVLDQKQLSALATHMLKTDDEGFTIRTISGRVIRADDVVISKVVALKPFGKSIGHDETWEALHTFYREISTRPGGAR